MAGDGSGIAELNPPLHSIMQREKCGLTARDIPTQAQAAQLS
jgi:hypothetical protein